MNMNYIKKALLVLALLICLPIPFRSASAAGERALPAFSDFVVAVADGQANMVRGVYVPGILALRVMQQPTDNPGSVLQEPGVATQFGLAARNHVIGLLAHNYLAGASFSSLAIGQEVRIVFGDRRVEYYQVNQLARFQALQLGSQNESYVDLNSNITYTAQDIFEMFYDGEAHVTFQTCIFQDGNSSWGRFFVTAMPVSLKYLRDFQVFRFRMNLDIASTEITLRSPIEDLSYP